MKRNYSLENFEKMNIGVSTNKYDIPEILPIEYVSENIDFIPFNFAMSAKEKNKGVHFFIHDYQFERVWSNPDRYCEILSKFPYVLSPDFSLYSDMPLVMQMWKHYQKQWMGSYMQSFGINVIPTIAWSDERSYEFCFLGCPKNSIVAVSSVGTQKNNEFKEGFLKGFNMMIEKLNPTTVLLFGKIPDNLPNKCKVIHYPHYMGEKFKKL